MNTECLIDNCTVAKSVYTMQDQQWYQLNTFDEPYNSSRQRTTYSCTLCQYVTRVRLNMENHARIHTGEKPYGCTECNYRSSVASNLRRHREIHRRKRERIEAAYNLPDKSNPTAPPTPTPSPAVRLAASPDARAAASPAAPPAPLIKLIECAKSIAQLPNDHQSILYSCSKCDFKTVYQKKYMEHEMVHIPAYACGFCPFKTNNKAYLISHQNNHTKYKRFKCSFCNFKTNFVGNLRRHQRLRHANQIQRQVNINAAPISAATLNLNFFYDCSLCPFQTNSMNALKAHKDSAHKLVYDIFDKDGKLISQVVHYE